MTELLNLPDLPGGMTASARTVVAVPGTAGGPSVAYKAPLATGGSAVVTSVAGRIGDVVLTVGDVAGAYAATNPSGFIAAAALVSYAPLASPALTGVPAAPTATVGTNTTQLATTAFVAAAVASGTSGVATFNTRTGAVSLISADVTGALTFTPYNATNPAGYQTVAQVGAAITSGTAANVSGTVALLNGGTGATTPAAARTALGLVAVATTGAYTDLTGAPAIPAASSTAPLVEGTAAIGASTTYARADHVHPSFGGSAYTLPPATATVLGGVKQGTGVTIAADGTLTAAGGGTALNPISTTYTAAGAITPANTLAYINSASAVAMTLAAAADTHTITIVNGGAGAATVTLVLFGTSQGVVLTQGAVLNVSYQVGLSTFIRIS